ncbi:MAG TPA: helix-hairpin-helix domain-containing protein [Candidatus Margulisiibacteriota bacterium]|nr:helix-hairpin-helix domain-containing protein [Candidatus Margulisiibacteriota bacterium]
MFAFTRQERQVLAFIIAVSLAGSGINFLIRLNSHARVILANWQNIGKVELNSADEALLDATVPGLGKKLAQRIIEYRQKEEGFSDLTDLKNIKGITAAKYDKIKDFLYLK